ncbi:hypothetical protein NSED_08610 [Candidatus Nitrosopumilus sediminis]|uniref:Uncharacterized protein n=1 Tax=Candidatus Nitrosopumilus sediminis TaxID=1229909 RepID=K0BDH9_9ARCH|nr:hypothetical protein NSED_08610 [Candidatus Nitrosopumilus sediminis]
MHKIHIMPGSKNRIITSGFSIGINGNIYRTMEKIDYS